MLTSEKHHTVSQRNMLLVIVIQSGRYCDAIQMCRKLETVQSDIHIINMLVNCYSRVGCIRYGFGLLGLILKRGLEPDVIFFTTLVKGLCLKKRVEEVGWVVGRMEELGCSPDEVMWGTFYSGLCSLGDWDAGVSLCDKITDQCDVDSDFQVRMNLLCHSVIIHHLIKKGFKQMLEQEVKPNYITLDAVRNARLKKRNRCETTQFLYLESEIEEHIATSAKHSRRSS